MKAQTQAKICLTSNNFIRNFIWNTLIVRLMRDFCRCYVFALWDIEKTW